MHACSTAFPHTYQQAASAPDISSSIEDTHHSYQGSASAVRLIRQQAPLSRLCQGKHQGFLQVPTTPAFPEAMSRLRPCTLIQLAPGVRGLLPALISRPFGSLSYCLGRWQDRLLAHAEVL